MKTFDLVIHTPKNLQEGGDEIAGKLPAIQTLIKFDNINWRQLLVRQLQFDSDNASFTVTDLETEQTLKLSLNAFSSSADLEFRIESDIAVITPQKDVFGLITRKIKDYIDFKNIDFGTARQYLLYFLNGESDVLAQCYKQTKVKTSLTH